MALPGHGCKGHRQINNNDKLALIISIVFIQPNLYPFSGIVFKNVLSTLITYKRGKGEPPREGDPPFVLVSCILFYTGIIIDFRLGMEYSRPTW